MIFATVGTQLPFDRLVRALDAWARDNADVEIFAQIGSATFEPDHLSWANEVDPREFKTRITACNTVVAHAGMGTIITAIELGKRVIVMPRRADLGEHRNDHQLATVSRLTHLRDLEIVHDANELARALSRQPARLAADTTLEPSPQLIRSVQRFAGLTVT
jgi:UDP-N-acetylglucosamine transferase subunit ALG13